MKKTLSFLILVLVLSLTSCSSQNMASSGITENVAPEIGMSYSPSDSATSSETSPSEYQVALGEKIIVNGSLTLETSDYDPTLEQLEALVKQADGYVQSFEEYRSNYYEQEDSSYRVAYYTLRIPADQFEAVVNQIEGLGSVTNKSTTTEDVTQSYMDLQARLTSYQQEEERLNELLSQAVDVTELLAIQDRLTEVHYQVEYYQTELQNLDLLTNYSTLTVQVTEETLGTSIHPGFGENIIHAFAVSLYGFVNFLQNAVILVIYALPYLVIGLILFFVIRWIFKKRKAKRQSTILEKKDE